MDFGKKDEDRIKAFEMPIWRKVKTIKWIERVRGFE